MTANPLPQLHDISSVETRPPPEIQDLRYNLTMNVPTFPLEQIRERRFNLIDRAQDLARQEIRAQGRDAIVADDNDVVHKLIGQMREMERHGKTCARIIVGIDVLKELRTKIQDHIDITTQKDLLHRKIFGILWGAELRWSMIKGQMITIDGEEAINYDLFYYLMKYPLDKKTKLEYQTQINNFCIKRDAQVIKEILNMTKMKYICLKNRNIH